MDIRIQIVCERKSAVESLEKALADNGLPSQVYESEDDALQALKNTTFQVIIYRKSISPNEQYEFLRRAKAAAPRSVNILLTEDANLDTALKVVNEGLAEKIITEPWKEQALKEVIDSAIKKHWDKTRRNQKKSNTVLANKNVDKWDKLLRKNIKARTRSIFQKKLRLQNLNRELQNNIFETIKALFSFLERKNRWIGNHSKMVAALSYELASELNLPSTIKQTIETAALLHDIGKIGIPDKIVSKSKHLLTKLQLQEIAQHPLVGQEIISPIISLSEVGLIIRHHHENYEGSGFPDGLKGEQIPLGARIIAVTDTFTNLIQKDFQRASNPTEKAKRTMTSKSGILFDEELTGLFLDIIEKKTKKPPRAKREKMVPIQNLITGMMISRDIITTRGTLVLRKGQVLSEKHLNYLREFDKLERIFDNIYILESFENIFPS